ncbi:helix-turn-helix domain-containing protein [Mycobacteroides abscessus]|uniref:helix-turn-helix transcriptional regulator n=1 Tax=Mycobacteroides abscessus TaxID=36809 RepID=UPI0009A58BFF|nr:helix-turn-helix transcriptional regulator [Mycobacteroides abscessus]
MDDEKEPDPVLAKVGELITIARTSRIDSPSIPRLATIIGIDVKTLRSIENGRSWPQDKNRRLIESSLQLRPGWLNDAKLAITEGQPVPTAVPADFIQSLGILYVPHLGRADTEEDWRATKIRMRSYCDSIAAVTTATAAANASPTNQGYRAKNIPDSSNTSPPGSGFPPWPWQPEINYLKSPLSWLDPSQPPNFGIEAAHQQLEAEHSKAAAQIMLALRTSTSVLSAVADDNRARINNAATELRNTLAHIDAIATSAPEPLADQLAALVAHARTTVDVLTGDKAQPFKQVFTAGKTVKLATHAYNAALAALKDIEGEDPADVDTAQMSTTLGLGDDTALDPSTTTPQPGDRLEHPYQ